MVNVEDGISFLDVDQNLFTCIWRCAHDLALIAENQET